MLTTNAVECPKRQKLDPNTEKKIERFANLCDTCVELFYETEPIGTSPGVLWEYDEVPVDAKYRIGPLTRKDFVQVRLFLNANSVPCQSDIINKIVYIYVDIDPSDADEILRLGGSMYVRIWRDTPRITPRHILFSIKVGFLKFWRTLKNPPHKPFVDEVPFHTEKNTNK